MALSLDYQSDNRRTSLQGGSTLDSSHKPAQKRHSFEMSPNIENGSLKPLNAYSTFVEAKERNSIVIDCTQFLGMEFKDKYLLKILREQFPKCLGLKPTTQDTRDDS
ncbi:uncharacterized protein B0P05DRAFT_586259 [Gilbertella persicaria]|uniref:uncharacterized protein n=1 Tax=Gilbertella persicaria TaxID=101096 RepID=UPI00221F8A21|nr:uncharacterized protein B0P05DRAFT_586259 [Gilbertella persicaria]KAI8082601.1 hypothetical protein B0P05DRAFT_586259 [Gilbertella persicaria]